MQVSAPELTARTMGSGRRNADAGMQPRALSAHLGRAVQRQPSGGQPTSDLHCCEPGVGHELTFVIADVEAAVASDPSFSSYGLQVLVGECSGSTESMPTFGSSAWAAVGVMGSIRWHCAGRRFRSYLQTRFPYSRMAQLTALPINFQKFHHF